MDERTPLLENDPSKVDLLYDRFSPEEKKLIIAIVSWGGLVPCEFFTAPYRLSRYCFTSFHLWYIHPINTPDRERTWHHWRICEV